MSNLRLHRWLCGERGYSENEKRGGKVEEGKGALSHSSIYVVERKGKVKNETLCGVCVGFQMCMCTIHRLYYILTGRKTEDLV